MVDVAAGSEAFDFEQFKREAEAEMQRLLDIIGRDTPEGQAMLRQWEEAKAPIPEPTKGETEETQLIDLRLLVPSQLHRRTSPSPEGAPSLERSIEANGLREPIEVRPLGAKFEISSGHQRAEAYQHLLDGAKTDAERAKYRAIPAKVRAGASDLDVVRWGIAGDLVRDEFSAADAARSLMLLRNLDPTLSSAEKLADATGLRPRRIERCLRLCSAPEVVQEAVRVGMTVKVEADGDEAAHETQRQLELLPGLEFSRLYAALSNKQRTGKGERRKTQPQHSSTAEPAQEAEEKIRQAIERALNENWGFREVKRYVDHAIAKLEGRKKMGRPRAPFKWAKGWLQVNVEQVAALDASQKAQLRNVLEQILTKL